MALRELVTGILETSSVRRVFGEPFERDGATVIPVARVGGMFGGGEGPVPAPEGAEEGAGQGAREGSTTAGNTAQATGWGGGGVWSATAAGVFVVRGGEATWVPAVDSNRAILLGCLTGIVSLLILRSVIRTLAKAR
jgi:uncharacterized spore protein YtfJ